MAGLTIGKLAEATDTKVQTIRYYESIGLLAPFTRTEGGHRLYDTEDRKRLTFIRHARELGFSTDAIRELLSLSDNPDTSCERADDIASRQLEEVEQSVQIVVARPRAAVPDVGDCSRETVAVSVASQHNVDRTFEWRTQAGLFDLA